MQTISIESSLANPALFDLCPHFEFHILLLQLALLTVSSFMHLYFLLKALIMIVTVTIYVFYSYHSNIYSIIADNYGIRSSSLLIETTLEVFFFILLLIGLDRRVNTLLFVFLL
jgi:hypothetical protein